MDRQSQKILRSFTQTILRERAFDFSRLDFLKTRFDADRVEKVSVAGAIVLAQVARAIDGDSVAASWIRDTAGEKPSDKVEVGLLKEGEVVINLVPTTEASELIDTVKPLEISDNSNKIK